MNTNIGVALTTNFMSSLVQDGVVNVNTLTHMLYDLDVLDFNNHLSARYNKQKE